METNVKKEIILNLKESSNAREFGQSNRIHQREFERAKQLIEERLSIADLIEKDKSKNKKAKDRFDDTISILGSRGSGKTSFLLSLLAEYEKNDNVEVLKIIDPTSIEEKGHIFLTIISLIEEAVSKKLNLKECTPDDSKYHQKKEWKDKLRKLADGLPSMDGVGSNFEHADWQDAEFIMDRGLKSVKAATKLEDNFNELVKFALKILGHEKKVFMLALDDIDVDFRKGWPVLETIRKYLTSPQLIVILSGDLKLYSKAIRKQQWKNFGKALLINEAERLKKMNVYNDLVTEMESQYMQKVIKPENRIHLTTLLEKVTTYSSEIKIYVFRNLFNEKNENNGRIEIQSYYNEVLSYFGIRNPYQAEAYTSYLLSLPIRTQIQFLSGLNSKCSDITDAFLSDLYENEVDIDLAKHLPKMLDVVILKLLLKKNIITDAHQLQPTTTDASLNGSLIALSLLFSQKVKENPYLIFDYMIKIGYVQNLLTKIENSGSGETRKTNIHKISIEELCQYSGIFQDKVLRDIVGKMNSYIESLPGNNENNSGCVYLKGTAKKEKGSNLESLGRIDFIFDAKQENVTTLKQTLAFIPISTSAFLYKNQSINTYSIYTLLGTIGELIRKIESDDLENGLLELSQWRTYPMISFEKGSVNPSNNIEYKEIEIKNDHQGNSKLMYLINNWYSDFFIMGKMYSPHLIGKISTRAYYSFLNIQNIRECNENLGVAMHRRLIALMNSILIEDVRENCTKSQGLNINNAITKDDLFINNLVFANGIENSDLSFSRWMLSCPLFLLYLDPNFLIEKSLVDYIFNGDYEKIGVYKDESIFSNLKMVDIKGQNPTGTLVINTQKKPKTTPIKHSNVKNLDNELILKTLVEKNVSYSIFEENGLKNKRRRNNYIRYIFSSLFPDEKFEGQQIDNLIEFIKEYDGVYKEQVKVWRQTQS